MRSINTLLISGFMFSCQGGAQVTLGYSAPDEPGTGGLGGQPTSPSARLPLIFTDVEQVSELSSSEKDDNPTLSADQLLICFTSERETGTGNMDVWCSERDDIREEFSPPAEPVGVNSDEFDSSVALSADGLTLWFGSARDGGLGGVDIWTSRRTSRTANFSTPLPEVALNSEFDDIPRPLGAFGTIMPLGSRRMNDLYWTYFSSTSDGETFGQPELLEELAYDDKVLSDAHLSNDGLLLLFAMDPEGDDKGDIFSAERASLSDKFGAPVPVEGVNEASNDRDPWLSLDETVLYFSSDRDGDVDIYRARLR